MQTPLDIARDGAIATLTMNRPEALNALSGALRRALIAAFDALDHDEAIRVVILTGAGRAFTAGLDVRELAASATDVSANVDAENVVAAIERFTKPLIAAVNGVAITGGVEIMLACDMVIASQEASFADTHVKIGLTPGWGLSQRLSRIVGIQRAKELSFTARRFGADEALAWGLVNHVVPQGDVLPRARALAAEIAQWPGEGVRAMKEMIDRGNDRPFGEAIAWEARTASVRNKRIEISRGEPGKPSSA